MGKVYQYFPNIGMCLIGEVKKSSVSGVADAYEVFQDTGGNLYPMGYVLPFGLIYEYHPGDSACVGEHHDNIVYNRYPDGYQVAVGEITNNRLYAYAPRGRMYLAGEVSEDLPAFSAGAALLLLLIRPKQELGRRYFISELY